MFSGDLLTPFRSPSRAPIHPQKRAANHRNRRRKSTVSAPIHDQNLPRITRLRADSRAVHRRFHSKIRNGFGSPAACRTPSHEQNRCNRTAATSPRQPPPPPCRRHKITGPDSGNIVMRESNARVKTTRPIIPPAQSRTAPTSHAPCIPRSKTRRRTALTPSRAMQNGG